MCRLPFLALDYVQRLPKHDHKSYLSVTDEQDVSTTARCQAQAFCLETAERPAHTGIVLLQSCTTHQPRSTTCVFQRTWLYRCRLLADRGIIQLRGKKACWLRRDRLPPVLVRCVLRRPV